VQDCSPVQIRLVVSLKAEDGQLFVVGDDAQAIYSFRGATNRAFLSLKNELEAANGWRLDQRTLTANYRSVPQVVQVCSATALAAFRCRT
jgi:DNA helicase II / ATP-dependent DNA helicase PcrA